MESQIKRRTAILLMGFVMMMYGCDDDTEIEMKPENEIMLTSSQAVTTTTHFEETTTAKSSVIDVTTAISETLVTTVSETTLPETTETELSTTTEYTEPQTEPSVLETEPPQTEPPVPETEPLQTEPSVLETEPPVEEIPSIVSEYQREVLRIVNEARAAEGLPAFEGSELLNTAANVRAQEIYASFSHTRPDGSSCFSIAEQMGISAMTMGENIAAGSVTPEGVVQQLLNSPPHRANIMSSDFTAMGVGYFETGDSYKYYWVQFFIG